MLEISCSNQEQSREETWIKYRQYVDARNAPNIPLRTIKSWTKFVFARYKKTELSGVICDRRVLARKKEKLYKKERMQVVGVKDKDGEDRKQMIWYGDP